MAEKKITVGIDVKSKNKRKKAKSAITELRRQANKHFRKESVIDNDLNNYFFKEGKTNSPSKVSIVGITKGSKVLVFLDGSESYKKYIKDKEDAKKTKESKKAKKDEKPKEKK
jgi:ribosomal protein L31E